MDSDPSLIPVEPIPFEHGLTHFAQSLTRGRAKIVAIGSSSTAGHGNIKPYPERLLPFLQAEYPNARMTMVNQGIGGQEAPIELQRFDTDVIAEKPDLVIWQVGTNAVWQSPDQNPPSFNETTGAIRDGLVKLRDETEANVILMDLQYVPAVLTPAKKDKAIAMVEAISKLAQDASVNVFRRFAFMKGLFGVEQVSFDRMVDPTDDHRLHDSDWATHRVAWAMKLAIVSGVKKARSSAAVPSRPSQAS
ncbi:lysophospholipase L1-like esterase [Bradyrhizobium sp. AZCC 1610]|uniref:SGNH/GDSL hydrolase family protein n=1 Tax=Bradyrhizobium sp. AZCC 1610 TaxID=3117020 RepID=UPI002FF0E212